MCFHFDNIIFLLCKYSGNPNVIVCQPKCLCVSCVLSGNVTIPILCNIMYTYTYVLVILNCSSGNFSNCVNLIKYMHAYVSFVVQALYGFCDKHAVFISFSCFVYAILLPSINNPRVDSVEFLLTISVLHQEIIHMCIHVPSGYIHIWL